MPALHRCIALAITALLALEVQAQPRASIDIARFEQGGRPYVELYVTAEAAHLRRAADGRRGLDLTVLFMSGDTARVADRVTLWSPGSDTVSNFVEALRYTPPPGEYTLRVIGRDAAAPDSDTATLRLATVLTLARPVDGPHLSDIQLAASAREAVDSSGEANSSLYKHGQLLEPLAGHLVRRSMRSVVVYGEVYDAGGREDEALVFEYTLARILDGGQRRDISRKARKLQRGEATSPILLTLPTVDLPSAPYLIELTLRDRGLQVIDQRSTLLHVINPAADARQLPQVAGPDDWTQGLPEDSLDYVLLSLLPVVSTDQSAVVNAALANLDPDAKRFTIFNHFASVAPANPAAAYRAYVDVVRQVDVAFNSGFRYGFQTDRGQIWLRYGQPNDRIDVSTDPSAPPYEIWVYEYIERTGQSPGKFLFYNPILDNASYVLLHSTVRGEINEPRWRRVLYSRTIDEFGDDDTVQGTSIGDNVGRYADQYFSDF